jgi:hypothetical protein
MSLVLFQRKGIKSEMECHKKIQDLELNQLLKLKILHLNILLLIIPPNKISQTISSAKIKKKYLKKIKKNLINCLYRKFQHFLTESSSLNDLLIKDAVLVLVLFIYTKCKICLLKCRQALFHFFTFFQNNVIISESCGTSLLYFNFEFNCDTFII